jgi:hypothetical protein
MQEVQDAGCNAIVEWLMMSTPATHLVAVTGVALHFHPVQLPLATGFLLEF